MSSIEFPKVETYYILKVFETQSHPDAFGSVVPSQRMDSGLDNMSKYTIFEDWQTELAKSDIFVMLDEDNNWYEI